MSGSRPVPNGVEVSFDESEILVSKTDPRGLITYANDAFIKISGYSERELIGCPHALVRHPDMPRCVFKLLWDTLLSGQELFAFVINLSKDGRHYWVLAHVTPDFDPVSGEIVGYHSSRRRPPPSAVAEIRSLYNRLLQEERRSSNKNAGMDAGSRLLQQILSEREQSYEQFVFDLYSSSKIPSFSSFRGSRAA